MDLYAQNILDRYKEPYYKDKIISETVSFEEVNHSCGDRLNSKLEVLNSKIVSYSFSGVGCAISQASADILGDLIIGKTLDEVLGMTKDDLHLLLLCALILHGETGADVNRLSLIFCRQFIGYCDNHRFSHHLHIRFLRPVWTSATYSWVRWRRAVCQGWLDGHRTK